jgi:hypothetical protein
VAKPGIQAVLEKSLLVSISTGIKIIQARLDLPLAI